MKNVKLLLELNVGDDFDDDISDDPTFWKNYLYPCDYEVEDFNIIKVILEDVK